MKVIEDPVLLAKKLVSIDSVTGNEHKIAQYINDYLSALDLKPQFQNVGKNRENVFLKGRGNLLINGHTDIVPIGDKKLWHHDPFGEIIKNKLYGRGSCDTKGSIACVLSALAKNATKEISCSFCVDEEEFFVGIKSLMKLRKLIANLLNNGTFLA